MIRFAAPALALILFGLSPKLTAQLYLGTGGTVTIADEATVHDEGARTWVLGGTLAVESGGALVTERFDVARLGRAQLQGVVQSRGNVNVSGTIVTEINGELPGVDYGFVDAAGAVDFAGVLNVRLEPSFALSDPSEFVLFEGAAVQNRATARILPGPEWSVISSPTTLGVRYATAPVPVTWLSFGGAAVPAGVALDWRTGTERGSDYFGVERLGDGGLADWREVGRVAAAGHSDAERAYDFLDAGVGVGTHYYRLRQVDLDGSFDYSETVAVAIGEATALSVYPNPVVSGGEVGVVVAGFGESPQTLRLVSAEGRTVLERSTSAAPGAQTLALPTDLAAGIYQITVGDGADATQAASLVVLGRP